MLAAMKYEETEALDGVTQSEPEVIGDLADGPGAGAAGIELASSTMADRFASARQARQSLPLSIATAVLVGAALAFSYFKATTAVFPAYFMAAGFLVVLAQQDAYRRKIPNWLVGPGIVIALAYNTQQFGTVGLVASLIGCALPLVMLLALYVGRVMGAGDIKALMALGTLWGGMLILKVIMWSFLIGGVMGFVIVLVNGELVSMLRRWWGMITTALVKRKFLYEPPCDGEAAAGGLPFGIAIGLGAAAAQLVEVGVV